MAQRVVYGQHCHCQLCFLTEKGAGGTWHLQDRSLIGGMQRPDPKAAWPSEAQSPQMEGSAEGFETLSLTVPETQLEAGLHGRLLLSGCGYAVAA